MAPVAPAGATLAIALLVVSIYGLAPVGPSPTPAPRSGPALAQAGAIASIGPPSSAAGPAPVQRPPVPFPWPAPHVAAPPVALDPGQLPRAAPARSGAAIAAFPATPRGAWSLSAPDAASPPDLSLNGSTLLALSSNTTVGNITLADNATLYVDRSAPEKAVTLTVLGDITLTGNATLYLNRSNLAIDESYDVEWTIALYGTSRLGMLGGNLTTNGFQWGAAYEDRSNATFVDSFVGYPSGWVDSDLVGAAQLNVWASWYDSDVILFDNALAPSTARFFADASAGFNVWLTFKNGTSASISLPGLDSWQNWTLPGNASATGVNYTIDIVDSFVPVWAVMAWQGADLTLVNSPDVAVALDLEYGTTALAGLSQAHESNFTVASNGLDVKVVNSTVLTWNLYPFAGVVNVSNSEVGEIQVFGSASASVVNSVLTGEGGYYGEQGSGTLTLSTSQVQGLLIGYSGLVQVFGSTFDPTVSTQVLATGTGVVYVDGSAVVGSDTFAQLQAGTLEVAWPVSVTIFLGGSVVGGAATTVVYTNNLTVAAQGVTDSAGDWEPSLVSWELNRTGRSSFSYAITAGIGANGSEAALPTIVQSLDVALYLNPLIDGSSPSAGATGVSPTVTDVLVYFTFPMMTGSAPPPVTISPTPNGASWSWGVADESLVLALPGGLLANTTYTVTVNGTLETEYALGLTTTYRFSFTTGAAPIFVPGVTRTSPSPGATGVSVNTSINVGFNLTMNASSLVTAFTLTPSAVGTISTTASALTWTPSAPLAANTTYQVQIGVSARSGAGAALPAPYRFSFKTAAPPSTAPPIAKPPAPSRNTTANRSSSPAGAAWTTDALIGVAAIVLVAVVGLLLLRRRAPPPPPAVAAPPPSPSPWDEGAARPPPSGR